jgi:hypothetical protein
MVTVVRDNPVPQVNVEALASEVTTCLELVPVCEGIGVKLSRLLLGFLQTEVLSQACRAADQGLDPTPLFAVVTDILRLYADALQRPESAGD